MLASSTAGSGVAAGVAVDAEADVVAAEASLLEEAVLDEGPAFGAIAGQLEAYQLLCYGTLNIL